MATLALRPSPGGQIVGSLACQKDSYLRSLDAKVVACVKSTSQNDKTLTKKAKSQNAKTTTGSEQSTAASQWLVEFSDSVMFPEGGGQPTDHGTVTVQGENEPLTLQITNVQRQGLRCICHSPLYLAPGTVVRQEIDFARRWDHMQQHTGQHLLSAIMDRFEGLQTMGWGMGLATEMNYVDIPRKPTEAEMTAIQHQCNEVIQQNLKITVEVADDAKLDKLPDDYDRSEGVIRVIKIGDLDRNTCCGTHLSQTSHISLILLGPTQTVNGKCRLSFIAGDRAIQEASSSMHSVRSIAKYLSSSSVPTELLTSVNKLKDANAALKRNETKLIAEIANLEAEKVKPLLRRGENAFIHRTLQGTEMAGIITAILRDYLGENDSGMLVFVSGEGKTGGQIMVTGPTNLVETLVVQLKEKFPLIKGGGKGGRWQGKVAEWKTGEIEALRVLFGC